jgi:metal-responsive CopG/Arc/MetJ family transcriptional regulator
MDGLLLGRVIMSALTIQMSPEVEEILTQFMRERGLTDRSEAICFVLREALQEEEENPRERSADKRIAAERKAAQIPPQRLRCAHDTWD